MGSQVTWALLRKEFRAQRVFLLLMIAFVLIDIVDDLTLHVNFSLAQLTSEFSDLTMVLLLTSFAIGSGLLIREVDNGTLAFIDGLPATRLQLFVVKMIVALLILQMFSLTTIVVAVLRHEMISSSLNRNVHPELLVANGVLLLIPALVGLGAGVLLGFLRGMSWLVFAALIMTIAAVSERWPSLSVLNSQHLFINLLNGNHVQWPVKTMVTQLIMGLVAMSTAAWIFSMSDPQRNTIRIDSRKWIAIPITVASVLLVAVGSYFLGQDSRPAESHSESHAGALFEKPANGIAHTHHYSFSYPANRAEAVLPLLKQADQIFEKVSAMLHIVANENIDVDLNGSMTNTEGTAFPNLIRMSLNKDDEQDTLAHETTHVFARRVVGDVGEKQLKSMTVFDEGLAHWVENSLSVERNKDAEDELAAAVVSARHLLNVHRLVDIQDMAQDVDENLKYPLGRLFIDCLVKRYGEEAPRNILKAIGREDFPRDLDGFSLWQTALQISGYDISLVFDDCAKRMKLLEQKYRQQILLLPRLHGDLVVKEHEVGVELHADKEMPEGWWPVVRFKPEADSTLEMYFTVDVDNDVAWTRKDSLGGEDVCYQPGIANRYMSIFEKWTCLPRSSASEW